ncbi:MAG: FtsW/RodA/SpoVE family cell cycle protein [Chloroflexi bacterium]|nr:FtsW/RodA/SpoVE family cell cycle protein [Chloroflexota bacterium]MCC6893573.1 FtsW/RodA/SpoVE family cell cycle protein [Anaerolineae bacterium]
MTFSADTFTIKHEHQPDTARIERRLLVVAGLFLLVNYLGLTLVRNSVELEEWVHLGVWVIGAVVGTALLEHFLPFRDPLLFPVTMFLSGWGLILIERLAPPFAERQTIWLAVSVAAMLVVSIFPHLLRWLRQFRYVLLLLGILLLVGTIVLGTNPSGLLSAPQLWLGFGAIFFQPSEALKIILVAFLASYLAEQFPAIRSGALGGNRGLSISPRVLGPIVLMWTICILILVWQRDLGTAILFFTIFVLLLYVASGSNLVLVSGLLLIIAAGLVAYKAFPVVQLRMDIWINPWPESDGRAFQIVQSLLAFAAGGTFGQGIAQGSPTYIPVVHSDFVFSALAEEWGLLGTIAVIACIAILVARGMRIAIRQEKRSFLALLAVGLSLLIATQSFLIMAGVLKLVPLTGITLPYLSYGGSSLLASFVILGLLLRLSALEN